jgi:glycosyltransferase involved in cell wall biosynthesis
VRRRGLEPAVRLLGYVPEEDLPWLYRGAELAVVPSQYEGFGLSALEAMACGTPVLAADASSLPEVVGGAGELFALGDPALLARRIAEITAAPERRTAMREHGLARAAAFSWDRTARRVLDVYREAVRT